MVYYQQFPYWRAFFEGLGFQVFLSRPSDRRLVARSLSMLAAETCFPVEVMHGYIHDLLDRGVDYVFAPFLLDNEAKEGNTTANYSCPWIRSYPFTIRGADHDGIPWENIAFDGQEDAGIETRLQAFVHQAREFARTRGSIP